VQAVAVQAHPAWGKETMSKVITISKPDAVTVLASARITGRMMVPGESRNELDAAMRRIESASSSPEHDNSDESERCLFCGAPPLDDEPLAWHVEWNPEGKESWVQVYANEMDAIDRANKTGGVITPLYPRNPVQAEA
jgi:hypothetical protein